MNLPAAPPVPAWTALPFAVLLVCIAVMPFAAKHWWEANYHRVSAGLGLLALAVLAWFQASLACFVHTGGEYLSFLALIGSLYVVSGGIHLRVRGEAGPGHNVLLLLVGAVLANVVGTTGASMLLIRPYIRMNRYRMTAFHTVFFIFIVSNVAGCLTPVGDPPLFLGYLKGVPFWWMLQHGWPAWLIVVGGLLAVFYGFDRWDVARVNAPRREWSESHPDTWKVEGLHNLFFLAAILGAVFINQPKGLREGLMVAAALGSWWSTPRPVHEANHFSFGPIKEVAWLFVGIFATMAPTLEFLAACAPNSGLRSEMAFYWLTGGLSAVLDNAPTYLGALTAAAGSCGHSVEEHAHTAAFLAANGRHVLAVSLGAVFFGAMTYIGNGPNFMVKAIVEHAGVKTPGFFAYILRYSLPILLGFLVLVSVLFFSPWRVL